MYSMKSACFLALISLVVIVGANPPSADPPGGLQPDEVPQFIVLGFDDNTSAEGMQWILDYLQTKTNPQGSGNEATFDGSDVLASFYSISGILQSRQDVVNEHRRAWEQGHEIGNHSHRHVTYGDTLNTVSAQTWTSEIDSGTQVLSTLLEIDPSEIAGFRAPYLEFSDTTFKVLSELNYLYDCSVQEGYQTGHDASNSLWPYTMGQGSPGWNDVWVNWTGRTPISSHPDLWQVPLYAIIIPTDEECADYGIEPGLRSRMAAATDQFSQTDTKITASDYGMWHRFGLQPNEFSGILKYNLDKRLEGNRAPFNIAAHTQYYTASYAGNLDGITLEEMRGAIENFIDYALSIPEVRITTAKNMIEWCSNPVPLTDPQPQLITLTVNGGSGSGEYESGSVVTIIADPPPEGQKFSAWTGDIVPVRYPQIASSKITIGDSDISVSATYQDLTHQDTTTIGNVVSMGEWWASADSYGSEIDTGNALLFNNQVAKMSYTIVPKPSDESTPWADLSVQFEDSFEGLHKIIIKYKSTSDIYMRLDQQNLAKNRSFKAQLSATDEWVRDTILVFGGRFKSSSGRPYPVLELTDLQSLSFTPVITNTDEPNEGTIEIKELTFYGLDWEPQSFVLNGRHSRTTAGLRIAAIPNALNITVPQNGNYTVSVISLDGRVVLRLSDQLLSEGINRINWDRNPAMRMFIVRVEGQGVSASRKIVSR